MKAGAYSLGQRRRLAVGAALVRRPTYLFLDEPTVGLDPAGCQMLLEVVRRMVDDGASVVLTGQDFAEAAKLADRMVVLDGGANVFEGTLTELAARRPPRVRLVTRRPGDVFERFSTSAVVGKDGNGRTSISIPCGSLTEAESVMAAVQRAGLSLEELRIEQDSLEESFTALVGQPGEVQE
jgi:ABC-type multidrug transport system ATPase subunit